MRISIVAAIVYSFLAFSMAYANGGSESVNEKLSNYMEKANEEERKLIEVLQNKDPRLIARALEDGNDYVKIAALRAIKATNGGTKIEVDDYLGGLIIKYVAYGISYNVGLDSDTDPTAWMVRREAAEALIAAKDKVDGEAAVFELMRVLRVERNYLVKMKIINALGKFKNPRAVDQLVAIVRFSKRENLVHEAVIALGEIGDPSAFADLLNVAQEDQHAKAVRAAAVEAIEKITMQ